VGLDLGVEHLRGRGTLGNEVLRKLFGPWRTEVTGEYYRMGSFITCSPLPTNYYLCCSDRGRDRSACGTHNEEEKGIEGF